MKFLAVLLFVPILATASDLTAYGLPTVPYKTTTLERKAYVVQHYNSCKAPVTSSEHLVTTALGGNNPREPFTEDPDLSEDAASKPSDYLDSGYDRGHLSPAEDFAAKADTMHQSFYMSNIVPQRPKNNRALWRSLEMRTRKYVRLHGDLYIITGASYDKNPKKIGSGVCVPTFMFKILIDKNRNASVAFMVPNTDEAAARRFYTYAVPISTVEKATQIDFTPNLKNTRGKTLDKNHVTLDLMAD